jgi:diadenosine tetraphosphate (Ap4A) HIT family hydrolase
MATKQSWDSQRSSDNCPFDRPREGIAEFMVEIRALSVATLYLEKIQTYRGHCVLIFDPRHVTRIDELSAAEWSQLASDIRITELALIKAFQPDHVNIASLGQVVPHLHWHIIPRYVDDPRWGGPIWTTSPDEMQKAYLRESEYAELVSVIRAAL